MMISKVQIKRTTFTVIYDFEGIVLSKYNEQKRLEPVQIYLIRRFSFEIAF